MLGFYITVIVAVVLLSLSNFSCRLKVILLDYTSIELWLGGFEEWLVCRPVSALAYPDFVGKELLEVDGGIFSKKASGFAYMLESINFLKDSEAGLRAVIGAIPFCSASE